MNPIIIAVIDDGINEGLYNIGKLEHNIEITAALEIQKRVGYDPFLPSHGTTCAAIIKKYSPSAVLSSIKILNETELGMKEQLVAAVRWCSENGINLINVSLGTIYYRDFKLLKDVFDFAETKGIITVAACNNRNIYTCPASLPNVIGVACDFTGMIKEGDFVYYDKPQNGVDIIAFSRHKLMRYSGEEKELTPSNSFATPMITAYVQRILEEDPDKLLYKIKEELKKSSNIIQSYMEYYENNIGKDSSDIPIMAIYDYSGKKANEVAVELNALFRNDGYNSIALVEKYNDHDPVSGIIQLTNSSNTCLDDVLTVFKIYDPDISIIAFDMLCLDNNQCCELEGRLEADIKIYITNDNSKIIKEVIQIGNNSEKIILTNTFGFNLPPKGKINVFDYSAENIYTILYKYIRELFERCA